MVTDLLQHFALVALADSPIKDRVQKEADKYRGGLLASIQPAARRNLLKMRDAIGEFARALVNCQNVAQVEAAYNYLQALNNGEVIIADWDESGIVTHMESSQQEMK